MSQFIIDMTREELILALKTANKERDLHERSAILEGQRLFEALKQAKGALADRDSLLAEIAMHGRDTFFSKWMENTLPKEEAFGDVMIKERWVP